MTRPVVSHRVMEKLWISGPPPLPLFAARDRRRRIDPRQRALPSLSGESAEAG